MKVCTDACIFGATIPIDEHVKYALDIGSGTGLLSLMIAQRSKARVDSVELNEAAALQCLENIGRSPWNERINVHNSSIQLFEKSTNIRYDLIVSNPPFFKNNLLSPDPGKNLARHAHPLTFQELANISSNLLEKNGLLIVMLPLYESGLFTTIAAAIGLYLNTYFHIKDKPDSKILRRVCTYSKKALNYSTHEDVIIHDNSGNYTSLFRQLLGSFYTIF